MDSILLQLFRSRPFPDGTRGVNEVPRWTLYASSPDASAAANVPDAAYARMVKKFELAFP